MKASLAGLLTVGALFLFLSGCPAEKPDGPPDPNAGKPSPATPATGTAVPTISWPEENRLVLEVEAAKLKDGVEVATDERASGKQCVLLPEGPNYRKRWESGREIGTLEFELPAGGDYRCWVRVFLPHECADSFYLSFDGLERAKRVTLQDSTYGRWIWIRAPGGRTFRLEKGKHTLTILNREDGALLDQVLLTTARTVPQGVEKAQE